MGKVWAQQFVSSKPSESSARGIELFEKKIRPILVQRCHGCHGEKIQMAGLRLDSLSAMLKGTENGHVVLVPSAPEQSAIIRAVQYGGEIKMPPTGKLPQEDIDALTDWVKTGAPWPEKVAVKSEDSGGLEFFEKKVRPIFVQRCQGCHGEKVRMAGLRLDSFSGMLKGTDNGHVVLVPGAPEQSAMIRAVRYGGEIKMPPTGKLPQEDIDALTDWVKMGAPWPQNVTEKGEHHGPTGWKKHWAFQPVSKPALPTVRDGTWVTSPIDAFVLAKLEANGLAPSHPADRRSLIRRASFDVTGLPPSADEVVAFQSDSSPEAFSKLVDRLLDSPHYGERWGRHWLDVARYGDTKGTFFAAPEELRYPFAYTYRDWVIRAFNEDVPYDRFVMLQIAADCLVSGSDKRPLAAMGFLTLGRRFQNNIHDVLDDRIDVVFRGTQGLTVGCARCHDHKYDPIPSKDYYSMYGVFANSEEKTVPLAAPGEDPQKYLAFDQELKRRERKVKDFLEAKRAELLPRFREQTGEYLLAAHASQMLKPIDNKGLHLVMVERWRAYLEKRREKIDAVFTPWHAFAALSEHEFAVKAPALANQFAANTDTAAKLNPLVAQVFAQQTPKSLREIAQLYNGLFASAEQFQQRVLKEGLKALPDPAQEEIRQVLFGDNAPPNIPIEGKAVDGKPGIETFLDEDSIDQLQVLKKKVFNWLLSPDAPPQALVVQDTPTAKNPHIFLRGNPQNQGEEVPRQPLLLLAGENRQPFQHGSGRLDLAQQITTKENPLTARVMVNRVWQHLFGAALVRTPSDFGMRSDPPTHPELLDYLARHFMEDGWSLKKLIRLIMLSNTYQQSSDDRPDCRQKDPENRLLWRMNHRRHDFESMRDAILAASGTLDPTAGGRPVDLSTRPFSTRRTIYGYIDRENLPGMFRIFDFAMPGTHSPQRYTTTVPQQALFMMNSPFVIEQARSLAKRSGHGAPNSVERIRSLYRFVYQRLPGAEEIELAQKFLRSAGPRNEQTPAKPRTWRYGYGTYDEAKQRVVMFRELPHWAGDAWQGGPDLPDRVLGRTMLTAEGGHPGPDRQHSVIRRWVAPYDGTITTFGVLAAPPGFGTAAAAGDGVQAWIISSRFGELGRWTVYLGFTDTRIERLEVKRGDTIDFIVDCLSDPHYDSFSWAPTIRMISSGGAQADFGEVMEWNATADFTGPEEPTPPTLTAWEKYAQVLLMSNEFVFLN